MHARSLEHFERLGFVNDFLAAGVKVHGAAIYGPGNLLLVRPSLDQLPTPYPFMLGLEQFETERLLTSRLKELGVLVERGVELVDFDDSGDHVSACLRHPDGSEKTANFTHLLGCDGAQSTMRNVLGLHLKGETLDAIWITADVKIRWDRDPGEAIAYLSPDGIVFIAAMNDDRWRVIVNLPKMTKAEAEKLTIEDVQTIVRERFGADVPLYDPVWISPFGINTRMAPTMRRGRVFLAGDAAHVHSPVGGQGMNTGIQDALNLSWKLALVLRGAARQELLESYNAERHANARRLLARVGPATKMASLRHLWGTYRRRDEGASPEGAVTEERRREMPQRAHALWVAPIFGPRYVAKLVRSTAATTCAWLLAIFRKLTATWHTGVFQQSPRNEMGYFQQADQSGGRKLMVSLRTIRVDSSVFRLGSLPPPCMLQFSLSPAFFIAKTQQQRFKPTNCLLLIGSDRFEDDTGPAIQIGSKHFQ